MVLSRYILASDGPQSKPGLSCRYDSVLLRFAATMQSLHILSSNILPESGDVLL